MTFGTGSTHTAFGSMPISTVYLVKTIANQLYLATLAPTTPPMTFASTAGLAPAAPPTSGFGITPFFGFVSTPQPQQAAPPAPVPSIPGPGPFDFGVNPVATPNPTSGFAVGNPSFAATPSFMGAAATPSITGEVEVQVEEHFHGIC